MKSVSFAVAIDSYIIRKGMVSILKNLSGTEIQVETDNPDVLKNNIREKQPDFIILTEGFFKKISQWLNDYPLIKENSILLISERNRHNAIEARSSIDLNDTREAVILNLETLINPLLQRKSRAMTILSDREETILRYVAQGNTNKQIAEKLFLSLHTVTTHRKNIGNKLGIKSVSGLTVFAIVNNIISIEDIEATGGS